MAVGVDPVSGDLCEVEAVEVARLVRERQVSAAEVVEASLDRMAALEPLLHAFCTPTPEVARAQARAVDDQLARGEPVGPLAGVPLGIKDMQLTKGIRTTFGSRLFADFVPDEDEPAVARVLAAGAVCLGKTNVPEFAFSSVGHNPLFETTTNPWNPALTPGGSSAGSAAAVAAGECSLAFGTDRAGSIRIPAAHCGIFGFKPSRGVVPSAGSDDFMTATGPLARTVADAALMLSVIAGYDDRDPWSVPLPPTDWQALDDGIAGLSIGLSLDWGYAPVEPVVREVVSEAASVFELDLGCTVEVAEAGWSDPWDAFLALAVAGIDLAGLRRTVVDRRAEMTPHVVAAIEHPWSAEDVTNANLVRKELYERLRVLHRRFDLLLTPTVAVPPFGLLVQGPEKIDGRMVEPLEWIPFTFPANMTGQPAASLPAGFTPDGLPVGLQLIGRRFEDTTVLRASAAFERAAPWHVQRPRVVEQLAAGGVSVAPR